MAKLLNCLVVTPYNVQKRILKKLDYFCQDDPFVYANKLTDYRLGGYRFRVGDYRIIFDRRAENSTVILKIGHRKEIYKQFNCFIAFRNRL